ncbi:MAG: TetR/AcrR family transcriptional regulator [Lachnospira eligens]
MAEISQKAGIAKGTFYLYFKDKYDIRNRLISHESSKLFKNAVADLEEFSIEKDEPLGFEEKIIFIINHIVDELNSNQTLLTFISKTLAGESSRKLSQLRLHLMILTLKMYIMK